MHAQHSYKSNVVLLRGTILNRTQAMVHNKTYHGTWYIFRYFLTNNNCSYLLWSPVIYYQAPGIILLTTARAAYTKDGRGTMACGTGRGTKGRTALTTSAVLLQQYQAGGGHTKQDLRHTQKPTRYVYISLCFHQQYLVLFTIVVPREKSSWLCVWRATISAVVV